MIVDPKNGGLNGFQHKWPICIELSLTPFYLSLIFQNTTCSVFVFLGWLSGRQFMDSPGDP